MGGKTWEKLFRLKRIIIWEESVHFVLAIDLSHGLDTTNYSGSKLTATQKQTFAGDFKLALVAPGISRLVVEEKSAVVCHILSNEDIHWYLHIVFSKRGWRQLIRGRSIDTRTLGFLIGYRSCTWRACAYPHPNMGPFAVLPLYKWCHPHPRSIMKYRQGILFL